MVDGTGFGKDGIAQGLIGLREVWTEIAKGEYNEACKEYIVVIFCFMGGMILAVRGEQADGEVAWCFDL